MSLERRRSARNIKPTYPTFPYPQDPTRSYNPLLPRPESERHLTKPNIPQRDPTTLAADIARADTLWESGDILSRHAAYDLYALVLLNHQLDILVMLRIYLKVISFLIAKDEYEMARVFKNHMIWFKVWPYDPEDHRLDVESRWDEAWELIEQIKVEGNEIKAKLGEDEEMRARWSEPGAEPIEGSGAGLGGSP